MSDDQNDQSEYLFIPAVCSLKTMLADGTLRYQIDIEPMHRENAYRAFPDPKTPCIISRLTKEADSALQATQTARVYGDYARGLVQSGFFRAPKVWEAVGTDAEFLSWVTYQKSAYSKQYGEYDGKNEGRCVAAHIRRIEYGSGTAEKPPYSAIPLTNDEHQLQHNQGESALQPDEWWERMRIYYVSNWAKEALKTKLNYESLAELPPRELCQWAREKGIFELLPKEYKADA